MLRKVRSRLSFANVIAVIALFVALGGSSYAALRVGSRAIVNNSIRSQDIRNGQVTSRDIKNKDVRSTDIADDGVGSDDIANNDVRSNDINSEVALAKGFASIQATNANGPANVLNHGGQQTRTDAGGVTAQRISTGIYDVTFLANPDTGRFRNVDNVNDLAWQVTGRNGFSTGSVFDAASSATEDQIKVRVFMRRPDNGTTIDSSFTVQFYARRSP
jgi:hypothetical protein